MTDKDNFLKALSFTLPSEGGYSNHPDDKGGMTYAGITQSTYNDYYAKQHKHALSIATEYKTGTVPKGMKFIHYSLKNVDVVIHITMQEVQDIYYHNYWLAAGCDKLPVKLAIAVFDCAVNQGLGRAKQFLAICNKSSDTFISLRLAHYNKLIAYVDEHGKKPYAVFKNGWLSRIAKLKKYLLTIK
jgi:lysozyme family protein